MLFFAMILKNFVMIFAVGAMFLMFEMNTLSQAFDLFLFNPALLKKSIYRIENDVLIYLMNYSQF